MLGPDDYKGLFAILPTPTIANPADWDAPSTVDLNETARLADALIRDGASGLIALGTTGECATLSHDEYEPFVHCLVETANHRVPVIMGATALGQREVIQRLRIVAAAGADGTLLGLPMWQPLTEEMAVRYYARVSEALPELSVMVYANERAFRFPFDTQVEFWRRLVTAAPTVSSAKFSRPDPLRTLIDATEGQIRFLPNETSIHRFAAIAPEETTGCWATTASMGPGPILAVIRAILEHRPDAVEAIATDIGWANEPLVPLIRDPAVFASYNIQIEKARINAAGYTKCGPVRPPYDVLPADYEERATLCGQRWAILCDKYNSPTGSPERQTSTMLAAKRPQRPGGLPYRDDDSRHRRQKDAHRR
jgi:trans-o-hydroxybenzylidenepyruvate hydratase-aldolase